MDTGSADDMAPLRDAVIACAADDAGEARRLVLTLAADVGLRAVVLVEGESDRAAVEALARRRGRDLAAESVCIVPIGGATSIRRFLDVVGPDRLDVRLGGLVDRAELRFFRHALQDVGLGLDGFFVCDADLEDELIRALDVAGVESVIGAQGELGKLRTFERQPSQRHRSQADRLHRFLGTHSGRKAQYARALVDALPLVRVPRPLDDLLTYVGRRLEE
ncbi:TOPRIM nucleotidyl transferase/hydrolase domain-containing protein [Aeromicrobium yanjiei]|uniref:ATP-dependent endonuclease n=1 Tax=Aeromicrobium yanjiei TaxID=2662028 RepID=A0A5Q2MGR2_9ACTN|nr:TOPRIM nucleotidyl transferase/hydrolase domain-containing protein [Aeromicrobium yanjiei]QGG40232.1 ATP-dependent endonuclease [Aeromicrobium yanjiei]